MKLLNLQHAPHLNLCYVNCAMLLKTVYLPSLVFFLHHRKLTILLHFLQTLKHQNPRRMNWSSAAALINILAAIAGLVIKKLEKMQPFYSYTTVQFNYQSLEWLFLLQCWINVEFQEVTTKNIISVQSVATWCQLFNQISTFGLFFKCWD